MPATWSRQAWVAVSSARRLGTPVKASMVASRANRSFCVSSWPSWSSRRPSSTPVRNPDTNSAREVESSRCATSRPNSTNTTMVMAASRRITSAITDGWVMAATNTRPDDSRAAAVTASDVRSAQKK
jgi:hypothetical protein